jgi:hypothetical protein
MPFLLDMTSRVITQIDKLPGSVSDWKRALLTIKRLVNDQNPHDIEWEPITIRCLLNSSNDMIFQDREEAFDVEYWYRGTEPDWASARQSVDYSDLDFPEISDEQYRRNLAHQFRA